MPDGDVVYLVMETVLDLADPLAVFDLRKDADALVGKRLAGRPSATYYYAIDIVEVPMNPMADAVRAPGLLGHTVREEE